MNQGAARRSTPTPQPVLSSQTRKPSSSHSSRKRGILLVVDGADVVGADVAQPLEVVEHQLVGLHGAELGVRFVAVEALEEEAQADAPLREVRRKDLHTLQEEAVGQALERHGAVDAAEGVVVVARAVEGRPLLLPVAVPTSTARRCVPCAAATSTSKVE